MQLICATCGNRLEALATEGSTLIVCPKCSQVVRVPHDGSVHPLAFDETLPLTPPVEPGPQPTADVASHSEPGAEGQGSLGDGAVPPHALFGNYELLIEIARGGMGVVFKARQVRLDRVVALKMILGGRFASPQDVQRFYTEATAAAQLQHPGIVPVFEVGEHEGCHYYSMAFVEGHSLAERLADGPLPPREAAGLTREIAAAVEYAHSRGVIHRDLKPGNVLLDAAGSPQITDFGLAKRVEAEGSHTLTGQVLGTPSFMAPEQAAGDLERVGPLSDVYSLGAVLYAMLTGHPPFRAASLAETLRQVQQTEPVSPRYINPAVDRDLETICLKCLQKEPQRRYASAQVLADDLKRFLDGQPIHARPVGLAERALRWCRREPRQAGLLGVIAALLVTLAGFGYGVALRESRLRVEEKKLRKEAEAATTRAEKEAREKAAALTQVAAEKATAERLAREKAQEAEEKEEARKAAVAAQEESQRLAARALYDQAMAYLTAGEHRRGMLWLVRALERTPEEDVDLQRSIRLALAAWQDSFRRPRMMFEGRRFGRYAALSPDGRRVVVHAPRGGWRIWDTVTGEPISGPLEADDGPAEGFYGPDGRTIAIAGPRKQVRLFDGSTGKLLHVLEHETPPNMVVRYAPDGKRLATRVKGEVFLWDVETGTQVGPALVHGTQEVYAMDFSSDGRRVAVGGAGGSVKIWDIEKAEAIATLPEQPTPVIRLAFTDRGHALLVLWADGKLQAWNIDPLRAIGKPLDLSIFGMAATSVGKVVTVDRRSTLQFWTLTGEKFSPFGSAKSLVPGVKIDLAEEAEVVVSLSADEANVWKPHATEPWGPPLRHTGRLLGAQLSKDGQTLLTLSDDGAARIWPVAAPGEGKWLAEEPRTQNSYATRAVFSPDGRYLLTAHDQLDFGGAAHVQMWDVAAGKPHGPPLEIGASIRTMAFTANSQSILVAGDKGIRTFDARTGKLLAEQSLEPSTYQGMAFTRDLRTLLSVGRNGLAALDVATGKPRWKVATSDGDFGWPLAISPDGRHLAVSRYRNYQGVSLHDLQTGTERMAPIKNLAATQALEFSPNGQLLAVAAYDQVQIWDVHAGRPLPATLRHLDGITSVRWSADGQRLLTASEDRTARLWVNFAQGELEREFYHADRVVAAVFSPDGRTIATSDPKVTRLWDASTGHPLGSHASEAGGLTVFSPSGQWLLQVGRPPQLWRVPQPVELDLKRLRDWAEALTGMRLELNNSIRALDPAEWRLRKQRLERSGVSLDL